MPPTGMNTLFLGRLVKAFGIRGELKFVGSDDFWVEALDSPSLVFHANESGEARVEPLKIERFRQHGKHFVIKFEGVDDRNRAEELVGGEFYVDPDRLGVDVPDRELPYQVVGSTVVTESGDTVGTVTDLLYSAAHPVYQVDRGGDRALIPAIPEFVVARDRDKRVITIRVIPGLLDEN